MDVTVEREQPVTPPVTSVTLVLALEEAQTLKLVASYRMRVGRLISDFSHRVGDREDINKLLFPIFRELHHAGVHAGDRKKVS